MSVEFVTKASLKDAVKTIATAEDLSIVKQTGLSGLIWERPIDPSAQGWIDSISATNLSSVDVVCDIEHLEDKIANICDAAGIPTSGERHWFESDILQLATVFTQNMRAPSVRVRIDVVKDNACSKFHIDNVLARLICTYRGPGTQYGLTFEGEEPEEVSSAPRGAPFLLRGRKWPDNSVAPLRHRSPPIEGTDITRIVLVLDPVF